MDARQRTRTCVRTRAAGEKAPPRGARQICLPMDRQTYERLWPDAAAMRQYLDELLKSCPELFPTGIEHGFQLTGRLPESKKLPGIRLRQLRLADGRVFTLRPSFVLSYMAGTVDEVAYPLLLLSFGVPMWVVTQGFGRRLGVVGPLAVCDLAGLDLVLDVDRYLLPDLESSPQPSPLL